MTKAKKTTKKKATKKKAAKARNVRSATLVVEKPAKKKTVPTKAFKQAEPSTDNKNLDALRTVATDAQALLKDAEAQAMKMRHEADTLVRDARNAFLKAIAPYKAACKKAGHTCEFKAKAAPKTEKVRFLVEKNDKGVQVEIKGRPETAETLDSKALKKSIMQAAKGYVERHIGDVQSVGFKHAGLYGRIRKVLGKMK